MSWQKHSSADKKTLHALDALVEKLYLKSDEICLQALLFELKTGKGWPNDAEIGGRSGFSRLKRQIFQYVFFYKSDLNRKLNLTWHETAPCDALSQI